MAAGEREAINVYGADYPTPDGTCVRDYIHVLDLADAHIATLEAPEELSGCYNAGTGRGNSVREVIDTVRRVTGCEIRENAAPRRPGDAAELVADPRRIQTKLGWQSPLRPRRRGAQRLGIPPARSSLRFRECGGEMRRGIHALPERSATVTPFHASR